MNLKTTSTSSPASCNVSKIPSTEYFIDSVSSIFINTAAKQAHYFIIKIILHTWVIKNLSGYSLLFQPG